VTSNYAAGIDPGFGCTGVIVRRGRRVIGRGTYSAPKTTDPPLYRAMAVADHVIDRLGRIIAKRGIHDLDVVIELPFYNSNPSIYEKQVRLIEAIEEGLALHVTELVKGELWLTEVTPRTSKCLATGDGGADKRAIIAASPFRRCASRTYAATEALADAWAHSLAAWPGSDGPFSRRVCLSDGCMSEVVECR